MLIILFIKQISLHSLCRVSYQINTSYELVYMIEKGDIN